MSWKKREKKWDHLILLMERHICGHCVSSVLFLFYYYFCCFNVFFSSSSLVSTIEEILIINFGISQHVCFSHYLFRMRTNNLFIFPLDWNIISFVHVQGLTNWCIAQIRIFSLCKKGNLIRKYEEINVACCLYNAYRLKVTKFHQCFKNHWK